MRLKLWKRIVIMADAAIGAAGAVLFLLDVLGCGVTSALNRGLMIGDRVRPGALALWLIVFACLLALNAVTLAIALRAGRVRGARLISLGGKNGDDVLLKEETLRELIDIALGTPDGVSILSVTADHQDGEVSVLVEATVSSAVNIQEATRAMQARVREQLTDKSGIAVRNVDVKVTGLHVDIDDMWRTAPGEQAPASDPADDGPTLEFEPVRVEDRNQQENH